MTPSHIIKKIQARFSGTLAPNHDLNRAPPTLASRVASVHDRDLFALG
jgi:hypothetical protein